MSKFYISCTYNRMIKALKRLGLDVNERASNHAKAEDLKTKDKITIPRHPSKELNKATVKNICDFLVKKGYSEEEVSKALGIKE